MEQISKIIFFAYFCTDVISALNIKMKHELQNVISGKSQVKFGKTIQAAASYLARSQKPSDLVKEFKQLRKQETENLSTFITENNLWLNANPTQ
jgi:hypothetical protein